MARADELNDYYIRRRNGGLNDGFKTKKAAINAIPWMQKLSPNSFDYSVEQIDGKYIVCYTTPYKGDK